MSKTEPFTLVSDERAGILRVQLKGFWTLAITQAYADRLDSMAADLAKAGARLCWLIDLTDFPVQSRDVAQLMAKRLHDLTGKWHPRAAVVVSKQLISLQTKNVAPQPDHRVFFDRAEAEAWLAEQP